MSLLSQCYDVRRLVVTALVFSAAAVVAFGQSPARLTSLAIVATIAGFFINAANSGFYSMAAQSFPSPLRAGGTFGDLSVHTEAHRLGAMMFDKPFDMDDLRTAVLTLMPRAS